MITCPACHRTFERTASGQIPYGCPHCKSTVLGVYCDLTPIGAGAMGDVYQARRPDMGNRPVAIKIPKTAESMVRSRFEREIAASARLRHENIVCAFDRGEEDGRPYLVLEFVSGRSLGDVIVAEHPLSPAKAAGIVRQVAKGLSHAAQHRIVNRDIKPDNILIAKADGTAKILDYGLALIAELDGPADRVTRNGTLLGTPGFLAPEQGRDPRSVTVAADVYSLGCTAYFMLSKRTPFTGKDSLDILRQHCEAPRPSVRSLRPDVDAELAELIERMMSVSPDDRPTPHELVRLLDQMIPRLTDSRPSLASTQTSGLIDARCPNCEEIYHLRGDMVGKRMQCRNKLCGERFVVQPQIVPTEAYRPAGGAPPGAPSFEDIQATYNAGVIVNAAPVVLSTKAARGASSSSVHVPSMAFSQRPGNGEPLEAEAVEAEAVEAEAVEAEAIEAEAVEAEAVDAEPVDAEPVDAEAVDAETVPYGAASTLSPPHVNAEPVEAESVEAEPVEPQLYQAQAVQVEAADGAEEPLALPAGAIVSLYGQTPPVQSPAPHLETVKVTAGAVDPADESLEMLPTSAIVGAAKLGGAAQQAGGVKSQPSPNAAAAPVSRRQRQSRRITWLVAASAALVLVAGVVVLIINPFSGEKTAAERWQAAQDTYLEKKWNRAEKEFNKFAEDFPEDPHTAEVPYFLDMCAAGENIFSDSGNYEQGLLDAQRIFKDHRDNPAYLAYCSDLYMTMARLVERFSDQAARQGNLEKIARARESLDLLKTVAEAMKDAWVPDKTQELEKGIVQAEAAVRLMLAKKELREHLQRAQSPEAVENIDDLYAKVEELLANHPELAKEKDLNDQRDAAIRAEAKRVRYESWEIEALCPKCKEVHHLRLEFVGKQMQCHNKSCNESFVVVPRQEEASLANAAPAEPGPADTAAGGMAPRTLSVVWDVRDTISAGSPGPMNAAGGDVIVALSRGIMYVFDTQGNFLWSRRLGIDVTRLPGRVEATATSPPALIAVSAEDNTLLALEAATGRVLWQYSVGGDIAAPLTIVSIPAGPNLPDKKRGLLPTPEGEIHVLELVLGKQIGRFQMGHPMAAVGGTYDPEAKLVYFPADSQRVFAVNPLAIDDPTAPACASVLFTEHASGALRSEPAVVGRYLIMPEASELERMKLRAYRVDSVGFANPRLPHLKELELGGWSWFAPRATPDRITLVTDEGDLGVFGLNLDNRDEAIYRIVEGPSTRLPIKDHFRALAVHADEHLLWVMAGGTLRKLSLDVLHQEIKPLWPNESQPAQVTGIPLHEAQMDRWGNVFYLTTMSNDGGHFDLCAVDSDSGDKLWQRQLGVKLFGDPLVTDDRVMLVDHSGRTVSLDPASEQITYQPAGATQLPPGAAATGLMRFRDDMGRTWLGVPLNDGRQLAVATLGDGVDGTVAWNVLALPDVLQGRPCVAGQFLVFPGADGHLYRVPLDKNSARPLNEVPFAWARDGNPGIDTAELSPLSESVLLIKDGQRRVRRLELKSDNQVTRYEDVGGAFNSSTALVGDVLVAGSRGFVADIGGRIHAFDINRPSTEPKSWNLGGRLSGQPFVRGNTLVAIVDDRRLACIFPNEANEDGAPNWISEPLKGRIRGEPVLSGGLLLATDDSRRVSGLRLSDGKQVWSKRLSAKVGPAATVVPFGPQKLLVPLSDGTLLVMPEPPLPVEAAEVAP